MYTISRQFSFCYGHRLSAYNGKCAHPHGHNGKVRIYLQKASLDSLGMVADFNELKNSIGCWIDEHLDHRMILQSGDPLIAALFELDEPVYVMPEAPTAENLAKLIYCQAAQLGLPVSKVKFWETENCSAAFAAADTL
ncbi:MAG: 6-carboxytetrahydropterin synthase [Planctomycetaceae bacterium]|nr:6-carboxytetrahydropterin synthase [Planctomycetaceae bacterium]